MGYRPTSSATTTVTLEVGTLIPLIAFEFGTARGPSASATSTKRISRRFCRTVLDGLELPAINEVHSSVLVHRQWDCVSRFA